MKRVNNKLLLAAAVAALLAGCGGGDINIDPQTVDNSVDNSGGSGGGGNDDDNPCAFYEEAGQTVQGNYDGSNCTYPASFVDAGNELTEDIFLTDLENDGAHIFEGNLFVGKSFTSDADLAEAGIEKGGDGPTLTVEAGATVAFPSPAQFMAINRGSQLIARGRVDAPITFTSVSDIEGTVDPEDVQQWGGIVINGFGVTNNCAYTGSVAGGNLALAGECHSVAEGSDGVTETRFGGDNNEDNSGQLEFVIVKHTGAEVAPDNELNGISFGAVGSGTIVRNLQAYSTFDDGIEMFGGAVSFENYVALYVNDDAIDIDEGWSGSITNALVIQSEQNGQRCVEADGIADYGSKDEEARAEPVAQGINSRPVINGLTCIVSPKAGARGPGAGLYFHEGIFPTVFNVLVISSFAENDADGDNACLAIEDEETVNALTAGEEASITATVFACQEKTSGDPVAGDTQAWAEGAGNQFANISGAVDATANANTELQLLEGVPSIFSIDTETMQIDGASVTVAPQDRDFLGALSLSDPALDWTQGWTFGLHEGNRAQPLWFEQQ